LKYIEKAILGVYYITWGKPAKKLERGRKLNGKGDTDSRKELLLHELIVSRECGIILS